MTHLEFLKAPDGTLFSSSAAHEHKNTQPIMVNHQNAFFNS